MSFRWVTDKSYDSGDGSQMGHILVTLSNTTVLIFFKLTSLLPRHNPATLRIRKMSLIFDQSEEGNPADPVVSLVTVTHIG